MKQGKPLQFGDVLEFRAEVAAGATISAGSSLRSKSCRMPSWLSIAVRDASACGLRCGIFAAPASELRPVLPKIPFFVLLPLGLSNPSGLLLCARRARFLGLK